MTSMTTPVGAPAASSGGKGAGGGDACTLAAVDEAPRCYRHPDRETYVSCSECGRPICPDCMVFAPVGIRCPDHSGQPQGAAKVVRKVQRASVAGQVGLVTRILVALNVGVYAAELAGGSGVNANS